METVSAVISPKDTMCDPGREQEYFSVGSSALQICRQILNGRLPQRILDFPCGYGRVTRWFRNEWPDAEIFGVEIDSAALDFVEETFHAKKVQADHRLNMTIPDENDLIFSGSLLTHLDEWQWGIFLEMCADALAPEGTLIFTTHGRTAALMAKDRHPLYGSLIDTRELYERYQETGFAFLPYAKEYPTFGLTLSSPAWIMSRLQKIRSVKIVAFEEGGWGQDVVAVRRNPWPLLK